MQQSLPCACLSYHMSYNIKQKSRGVQTPRLLLFRVNSSNCSKF